MLSDETPSPEVEKAITNAVASPEFPARDQHAGAGLYTAFERHPEAVGRASFAAWRLALNCPTTWRRFRRSMLGRLPHSGHKVQEGRNQLCQSARAANQPGANANGGQRNGTPGRGTARNADGVGCRIAGVGRPPVSNTGRVFVAALAACDSDKPPVAISAIAAAIGRPGSRYQDKEFGGARWLGRLRHGIAA